MGTGAFLSVQHSSIYVVHDDHMSDSLGSIFVDNFGEEDRSTIHRAAEAGTTRPLKLSAQKAMSFNQILTAGSLDWEQRLRWFKIMNDRDRANVRRLNI